MERTLNQLDIPFVYIVVIESGDNVERLLETFEVTGPVLLSSVYFSASGQVV